MATRPATGWREMPVCYLSDPELARLSQLAGRDRRCVLWTTSYLADTLDALRAEGPDVDDENAAQLTPAQRDLVNSYGTYSSISTPNYATKDTARSASPPNRPTQQMTNHPEPFGCPGERQARVRASARSARRRGSRCPAERARSRAGSARPWPSATTP